MAMRQKVRANRMDTSDVQVILYPRGGTSPRAAEENTDVQSEDLLRLLKTSHHTCVRTMCRVTLAHTHRHRIRTTTLLDRVRIKPLTYYYRNRILRWAGHVARMPIYP